ncbi:MAG: hypothetical protein Q9157_000746 [Trypethelium eluteriae]
MSHLAVNVHDVPKQWDILQQVPASSATESCNSLIASRPSPPNKSSSRSSLALNGLTAKSYGKGFRKQKQANSFWNWISSSLGRSKLVGKVKRYLRTLRRGDTTNSHNGDEHMYDIRVEEANAGRTIVARALFDPCCYLDGILVSKDFANKIGLPDKENCHGLKTIECEDAFRETNEGYTGEGCTIRWNKDLGAKNRRKQKYFFPKSMMESQAVIFEKLQLDMIIGDPEVKRLGLDKRPLLDVSLISPKVEPDTSMCLSRILLSLPPNS